MSGCIPGSLVLVPFPVWPSRRPAFVPRPAVAVEQQQSSLAQLVDTVRRSGVQVTAWTVKGGAL